MKTWQDKNSSLYDGLPFMKIIGEYPVYPCVAEIKYDGEFNYLISRDKNYLANKKEHGRIRTEMPCTSMVIPNDSVFIGELIHGNGTNFYDLLRHKLTEDLRLGIFGVLRLDGIDVWKSLTYVEQRKILESQTFYNDRVFLVPSFKAPDEIQLKNIFDNVCLKRFEGIVIKDPTSKYISGETGRWVKWKKDYDADLVIMGFMTGTKRAKKLSLLLGHKSPDGTIQAITHCGGGLKDVEKDIILAQLQKHVIGKVKDDYLVEPKIVVTIKHNGIISNADGSVSSLRHPRFKTIRQDKTVGQIDTIK